MPDSIDYDSRFLAGVLYFNACEFFEAHEVWEELWAEIQGDARPFFQGMIQAAVCLHHFGNGNTRGALKLYHGCRKYLEPFQPYFYGVQMEQFLEHLHACCEELLACQDEFPKIEIVVDRIPEISLDPEPAAWPAVELDEDHEDDEDASA